MKNAKHLDPSGGITCGI